jgi:MFS family permease
MRGVESRSSCSASPHCRSAAFSNTLWDDPYYLVSIQILDGIGAGIFGALFFVVVADLTRGSGRYNLAQGAASAAWGFGAALSNSVAGFIADKAGFDAAFLFLAAAAIAAFLLFWLAMPETGSRSLAAAPELIVASRLGESSCGPGQNVVLRGEYTPYGSSQDALSAKANSKNKS